MIRDKLTRSRAVATLLFCFIAAPSARGQVADEIPNGLRGSVTNMSFQHDGKEYRYHITTDDVKDTPSWDVSTGEPPLSFVRAVEIGKVQLNKLTKATIPWDVDFVKLIQADRKKWYYEIHFNCLERGCPDTTFGGFPILVKMDGTPVDPKVTKVKAMK